MKERYQLNNKNRWHAGQGQSVKAACKCPKCGKPWIYLIYSAQLCIRKALVLTTGTHHSSNSHLEKQSQVSVPWRVATVVHRFRAWNRAERILGMLREASFPSDPSCVFFILGHFGGHFSLISAQFLLEYVKRKNHPLCIRHLTRCLILSRGHHRAQPLP